MQLSKQIEAARLNAGLRRHALAVMAGVHHDTVRRVETGQPVKMSSIDAIVGALGLKIALVLNTQETT